MIILITGASHIGKTLLAQRMLEKYNYPYLSIDHLKMGLIRSGNTGLTPEDDDALTTYLWPIVREIIKTAIENRQNLIVEGCYIPFDWRQDFDEHYLPSIRVICLAMSERYIENHFDEIIGHTTCERKYFTLENNDIIYKRLKEETDLDYLPYLGACVDFGLGDLVLEEDIDKFKVYFIERMSKYDYMEYGNLKDAVDDLINKCTRYKDNKDEIQEKMRNIFYETLSTLYAFKKHKSFIKSVCKPSLFR